MRALYWQWTLPFWRYASTHVGIPLLLVYYAFKHQRLKKICMTFYLLEIFSTLYLNQHYLIDLVAGSFYALIIASCVDYYYQHFMPSKSKKLLVHT